MISYWQALMNMANSVWLFVKVCVVIALVRKALVWLFDDELDRAIFVVALIASWLLAAWFAQSVTNAVYVCIGD